MPRATNIIAAKDRDRQPIADSVLLDHAQRSAARATITTAKGRTVDLDMPAGLRLRTDDILALDDGSFMEVVARPDPLIEARAAGVAALARLAWHLGDRHIAVELLPNRIRVLRSDATQTLLASLGAKIALIDAPFEPEGGAYAALTAHGHHHHDHHARDHSHDHHDHGHGHKHVHSHD